ncbi:gliding motility-associated lipoprotein GldH [Bernardetia litoralis DSM 6794]|uniref:Gliding motility-associated lipoprotein GldH n=1 Tax=Bernardetia litoralis (strain ATCC 23117 / DSM 6794 / NBRC 15988 / NCIMB 1366 / Fx l1 / Sio-4) TaxID=880071 RepID=I4ALT8_BERLS|nr:gliding motility lipoprotein GldH [Bernardetia litoralis]AFM04923.1 gliding motility-associated lipoprotein GldH [Bernardetia litoralis DSM 6794]
MQFLKKNTFPFLILSLLLFLVSCGNNGLYENHKELSTGFWQKNNLQSFEVEINDSQNHFIFYHLRYTSDYDYCNTYIRYKIFSPAGKLMTQGMKLDTLFDCTTGKPLGEGFGNMYNREFELEQNFDFSEKGIYKIELEQMMRKDSLEGIQTVGIRIAN